MKCRHFSLTIIALVLSLSISAFGQATLSGIVTDSLMANLLVGANVYLVGTALGSSTDLEGQFQITRIPPGQYQVKVSYIGYLSKEYPVQIQQNQNIVLDIELNYEVIQGEAITVTAQAEGQVAAINQQITSNTIINVVSEEKIKELPDANAAEAIGRLPGVSIIRSEGEANKVILRGLEDKFTTVTIDGVKIPSTDESI